MRSLVALLVCAAAGCGRAPSGSGIELDVEYALADAADGCVRVRAVPDKGMPGSDDVSLSGKPRSGELSIAIARGSDWSTAVKLIATLHRGDCSTTPVAREELSTMFPARGVDVVRLRLIEPVTDGGTGGGAGGGTGGGFTGTAGGAAGGATAGGGTAGGATAGGGTAGGGTAGGATAGGGTAGGATAGGGTAGGGTAGGGTAGGGTAGGGTAGGGTAGGAGYVFPFTPSNNIVPSTTIPDASVRLDCNAYVDTDNAADPFEGWCGDRPTVSVLTQTGGPEVLVLSMASYFQDAGVSLYAYGNRAVAFVVYGDMVVGGGTHPLQNPDGGKLPGGHSLAIGQGTGPGVWCLVGLGNGANGAGGIAGTYGGGGGGAFGRAGASAGDGAGGFNGGLGGLGGSANGNATLTPLRGGCSGGNGGPTSVDFGGTGGGAIQLVIGGRLIILPTARVGASGYGGRGGNSGSGFNGGGGGGGSGGGVLIECMHLDLRDGGFISANGAGAGQGDGDNDNGAGAGASANRATVGAGIGSPGANGGGPGGRGGDGGSTLALPATIGGDGASGRACGGGGGGSPGRVRLNVYGTCTVEGTVSGIVTSNIANCP